MNIPEGPQLLRRLYDGQHQLHARAVAVGGSIEPGTKQMSLFAVGIPFMVVTAIVIGLRIWVRVGIVKDGLKTDDFLMILGTICNFALSIANMICGWYGAGVHVQDIPLENYEALLKSNFANRFAYVIALGFVKLSLLFFYRRIDPRKWIQWTIYFIMFTVIGLTISTALICIWNCTPPSKYWDVTGQQAGRCMPNSSRQTFFETNGIINIVQDVGIYLLPMPMIRTLQVRPRKKIALAGLFGVGFIALVAGCIRYYYVLKLANEADIWYYFADSLNWCSIEVYAATICGCASTFNVLVKTYLPRVWGSGGTGAQGYDHRYDHSRSGQFALKTFGGTTTASRGGRRGLHDDITIIEHTSQEAIVPSTDGQSQEDKGRIVVARDFIVGYEENNEGHSPNGRLGRRQSDQERNKW
ncbi:hypothetical protein F4779DRAFT_637529, partial [Xylariaceae sp. FL0662B]